MKLAVGQVYDRIDAQESVVVLEVRDERHPRGLGRGYGDSAIAVPIEPRTGAVDPAAVHPFDAVTICEALERHGSARWRLAQSIHYEPGIDGILYAWPGPHPVRGDE